MRASISLSDLQRYASKLPDGSHHAGRYHRFAIMADTPMAYAYYDQQRLNQMHPVDVQTIEFNSREIMIQGVRALAWYYHDILVKVSV